MTPWASALFSTPMELEPRAAGAQELVECRRQVETIPD
jgi:hypothetical protein